MFSAAPVEQSPHLLVEGLGSPGVDRQRADDVPAPTQRQRGRGRDAADELGRCRLRGVLRGAQLQHSRRDVAIHAPGPADQPELVDVVVEATGTRHPDDAAVGGDRGDPRSEVAGLIDRNPAGLREQLQVVGRPDDRLVHLREAAVGPGQRLHPFLVVVPGVTSVTVATTRNPPAPKGVRLISAGNSLPSLRSPQVQALTWPPGAADSRHVATCRSTRPGGAARPVVRAAPRAVAERLDSDVVESMTPEESTGHHGTRRHRARRSGGLLARRGRSASCCSSSPPPSAESGPPSRYAEAASRGARWPVRW